MQFFFHLENINRHLINYIDWKLVNMGWFVNEFPKYVFLVSKWMLKVYLFYLPSIHSKVVFVNIKVKSSIWWLEQNEDYFFKKVRSLNTTGSLLGHVLSPFLSRLKVKYQLLLKFQEKSIWDNNLVVIIVRFCKNTYGGVQNHSGQASDWPYRILEGSTL